MTEPYVYGYLAEGQVRRLLCSELSRALYVALVDITEQRAQPLGIRWGQQRIYTRQDLLTLHSLHAVQLASKDHWPVIQVLRLFDSAWP